jgi:choline dehydrogenase-like flavoprotein
MDSSAIPTSLGVNPSLTIAAVCERAAGALTKRAGDFGLPVRPKKLRPQRPPERVGPHVKPARAG